MVLSSWNNKFLFKGWLIATGYPSLEFKNKNFGNMPGMLLNQLLWLLLCTERAGLMIVSRHIVSKTFKWTVFLNDLKLITPQQFSRLMTVTYFPKRNLIGEENAEAGLLWIGDVYNRWCTVRYSTTRLIWYYYYY